ncbi:hypothetical protein A7982_13070 [Minicystis rosea]|nr:hypothetical protein A7982_13070 [Minicystis rosea]
MPAADQQEKRQRQRSTHRLLLREMVRKANTSFARGDERPRDAND